jgi:hypothetical protein
MGVRSARVMQGRRYRTVGAQQTGCGCLGSFDYLEVVLAVCYFGDLSHVVTVVTASSGVAR